MTTVTFTRIPGYNIAYTADQPDDHSGRYVRAEVAEGLLAACKSLLRTQPQERGSAAVEADIATAVRRAEEPTP